MSFFSSCNDQSQPIRVGLTNETCSVYCTRVGTGLFRLIRLGFFFNFDFYYCCPQLVGCDRHDKISYVRDSTGMDGFRPPNDTRSAGGIWFEVVNVYMCSSMYACVYEICISVGQ